MNDVDSEMTGLDWIGKAGLAVRVMRKKKGFGLAES